MPIENDRALVLRLTDYSETSQIATLLTRQFGQVRLIAKGARRSTKARAAVGLDLLELGEAAFVPAKPDAGLGTLTEWKQLEAWRGLRDSLATLCGGLYAAELAAALTLEHDPHPELFDALLRLLETLAGPPALVADANRAVLTAIVRFQADLLKSIGLAPNLRQCISCGKARRRGTPAWFSSHGGGLVCEKCQERVAEKHPIEPLLLDGAKGTTPPAGWFALLDYHLSQVGGRAWESGWALRSALAIAPRDL